MSDAFSSTIARLVSRYETRLGKNDAAFLRRVYSKDATVYRQRVRQYGFVGRERVLDAGCGFGQWSLALSAQNELVHACDQSKERLAFLQDAVAELGLKNLRISQETLGKLSCASESFDAVLCYGVLWVTPWRETLADLVRVVRPGGRLYVNAAGIGWYKHLWYNEPNKVEDYEPRYYAAHVLLNTWNYAKGRPVIPGMDILIEPAELKEALEELGCEGIVQGPEGLLNSADTTKCARAEPFFAGEYMGDLGLYEMIAVKGRGRA